MARSGGKILTRVSVPPAHAFGTPEEIQARDKVAKQFPETRFEQIGPEDNAGMNLANPTASNRSGNFKFSRGV